jgi:hypothetical protein
MRPASSEPVRPPRGGDPRLRAARRLAWWLDASIPIPGTSWRVGIDPIVGLLPGIGDLLSGLASVYLVVVAARLGAPLTVLARLALNLAVDAAVGSIPLAGDAFDFAFRANLRNLAILERWLERPREVHRRSAAVVAAAALGAVTVLAALTFAVWSAGAWAIRSR